MKGYPAFTKTPALQEPNYQIVLCPKTLIRGGGLLSLCREAVCVFYSPNLLGNTQRESERNGQRAVFSPSIRKVTLESARTAVA